MRFITPESVKQGYARLTDERMLEIVVDSPPDWVIKEVEENNMILENKRKARENLRQKGIFLEFD
jgi:hypothetical protein|nr:MAG TPA: hypothetical protein [Caudoviricetes sp.]